jgi:hypothetical protein
VGVRVTVGVTVAVGVRVKVDVRVGTGCVSVGEGVKVAWKVCTVAERRGVGEVPHAESVKARNTSKKRLFIT